MAELDRRFRSITLAGVDAASATSTMLRVLSEESDLGIDEVAPGRIAVSRTTRPRWATVAAIALCWLGGLGLLFLLVRRTEADEALVVDAPRGCVVTIPPVVDDALVLRVEEAFAALGRSPAAVPEPAWDRVDATSGDGLDDRTVARTSADAAPTTDAAPVTTSDGAVDGAVVLGFSDGDVVVYPGEIVVLGRDPSPDVGRPVVVPADSSTVSKSHLRVEWDGATLTATDLHSTNGSSIGGGDGRDEIVLEAGTPTPVDLDGVLTLGAASCTIRTDAGTVP
ncbi:MAG: FHA domain-containing protein [Acidimicrobiales bacterium]|nr:FHA domain-containing protein [Acidimicrobiales bacterium]